MSVYWQTPKLKELKEQCASCPFRRGNDKEFGEIVRRICKSTKQRFSKFQVTFARGQIEIDCMDRIDFACHCTVYDDEMNLKSTQDRRQCPGASQFYRQNNKELSK